MTSPKAPKDKIFEKVINPYLTGVLQHPQSSEMRQGMFHIRDVGGSKKTGSMETRLEAMEQQVFKCQGMVERGLNANHMMITEFTNKHMIDANDIGKQPSTLYDRIDQLQAQIYDLQNQNWHTLSLRLTVVSDQAPTSPKQSMGRTAGLGLFICAVLLLSAAVPSESARVLREPPSASGGAGATEVSMKVPGEGQRQVGAVAESKRLSPGGSDPQHH
ncbi:hypothetical protein ZWY2020_005054 [Hordeum vulgare]|nr:hypothetical protein ZWY2020_005054 [Hordeum vulgare]